eukprot:1826326-Ditylum_brightwellii.AAC.1
MKHGLSAKEVKDLNTFVKDKINKMIKEHCHDMHAMIDFKELLISSSNKTINSILSDTSVEDSKDEDHKLAVKK